MSGITLAQAQTIVGAALEKGRELDLKPLAIAVLDPGGHLKAFAREDGAGIVRPDIAIGKAWGALGMGMGSRALAKAAAERPSFVAALGTIAASSGGRVVPAPGGVLVRDAGGALLGAVGVTGDVSDQDEACALAGIAAAELEGETG